MNWNWTTRGILRFDSLPYSKIYTTALQKLSVWVKLYIVIVIEIVYYYYFVGCRIVLCVNCSMYICRICYYYSSHCWLGCWISLFMFSRTMMVMFVILLLEFNSTELNWTELTVKWFYFFVFHNICGGPIYICTVKKPITFIQSLSLSSSSSLSNGFGCWMLLNL